MIGFTYHNPAKIAFGSEVETHLSDFLREEGATSLMLVYSGDFIKELGIYQIVESVCEKSGIAFYANGNVVPNPEISLVRELVEEGRARGVDFVLAVGGGSSIDTAKATALGIPYEGDVWDFFGGRADASDDDGPDGNGGSNAAPVIPEPAHVLPIGVITTLPASGSETSNAAILSNGAFKIGFEDNRIIPRFAIMNPQYTVGLPAFQTACGTADILSHLLERYFSDVPHTDVTDYLIEGGVRALLVNGERLAADPGDLDARAEIQWLASIAHNNLLDTGRIGDWGSHRIEHELSAQYGITHGEGMAVILPAWIRYAAVHKPEKPAQLAVRVFGVDPFDFSVRRQAEKLAGLLTDYFKKLGLRTTLRELGIDDSAFEEMALRATKQNTQPVGHYIPLDVTRFCEVLQLAGPA